MRRGMKSRALKIRGRNSRGTGPGKTNPGLVGSTWIAGVMMIVAPLTVAAQPAPSAAPEGPATTTEPLQARADASADDVPPPPPPAPSKPAELPKKLAVGKDSPGATFGPGVLLQGWFVDDTASVTNAAGQDVTITSSTFRVRRAEISASGELIPKGVKYKVMFDPSRVRDTLTTTAAVDAAGKPVTIKTPVSALSTLQDLYITLVTTYADVSIGQFKIPVSWEGVNSSAKLILPERAFVATLLGDKRDLGLRIEKTFDKWGYMAGVWNGTGLNNFDNNNQKDAALRLEVYPIKGLTLAGVTYDSVGYRGRAGTKDRWEADLRYEAGPFLFQSEYIQARDRGASASVTAQGLYGAVAYKLGKIGSGMFAGELQPVVRVGYFDPDTSQNLDPTQVASSNTGGNDERIDYEVGLNYYLRGHELKLQASYDRQQFDQKTANNELIVAAQIWF